MKKTVSALLIALAISFASHAQLSADTVKLEGRMVYDILHDFENSGKRLLQNAQTSGNIIATKTGNEILLVSQNINHYFEGKTDKGFDILKSGEQNLFTAINKIIDQFNNHEKAVAKVSELTSLDLTDFTDKINSLPQKPGYAINFVSGTTLTNSDEPPYTVSVTGYGFMQADSRKKFTTSVYINDTIQLSSTDVDITRNKQMLITVPDSLIKPFFKDNQIVYIPVKIISRIVTPGGVFDMNNKGVNYETKFNLVLMPVIAGEIKITETITHNVLDDKIFSQIISRTFKDCMDKKSCDMVESWHCRSNQKIVGVRYQCGGQCNLSYKKRPSTPGDENAPDFDILNDGKMATVYRHLEVENPTTIFYYIDYKNYKDDSVTLPNSTIKLKYGEQFDVWLNAENTDCNYSITGKLNTGQVIDYNNNTILGSAHLKFLDATKSGNRCKITFRLVEL
ncbi:MAG: hypothetical protein JST87_16670 [Bacteroidetes bacterium]|nr:hypothetical protein [Bacteroidota bacterium]